MLNRPTILWLMALIAYIALGMAAVRANSGYWAGVVLGLTVLALCTATLLAFYRRGAWAGFSVFGWAWFLTFQPQTLQREESFGVTSLPITVTVHLMRYFTGSHIYLYSLNSAICLSCVAIGSLGALMGWGVDRAALADRRGDRLPVSDRMGG